jgi:glycyl-tRNA synthetase (class II)
MFYALIRHPGDYGEVGFKYVFIEDRTMPEARCITLRRRKNVDRERGQIEKIRGIIEDLKGNEGAAFSEDGKSGAGVPRTYSY